ncbi:DUF4381 domain-containing protein [Gilvimarinus sp. SDUM040013]|uniref:DUF4381 domain-containing protein n=1 Tax=Gilvimarinus gilvus TaxID=3058038 RepID=A0ABU4RWV7_9GAMM|nr:DUF4381 domain-containing protein [Gilvimarinus sp. SDUM040013]MDO3388477.1 DUF4381 domain-containing protein [Gilvimarinus sp. SDUM040013]MDX6848651.1 DUF4381 domain-containing protein [Gilvimarinus sp. SDUM040013]
MDAEELDGLEVYQLFDRMEPLAPIEPISMMPTEPGWWVLGGVILVTFVLIFWLKRRVRYQNRHRYLAIEALNQLPEDYDPLQVSAILKRCVLTQVPRVQVASLYGQAWSDYLNACLDGEAKFEDFYALKSQSFDRALLRRNASYWLAHHRLTL